jgi:MFS family permease
MKHAARVLRHRDFRRLWMGQSISTVGDRLVTVALALFVTDLTGSPALLGLVLASYTGSLVIFLLVGGVWADRLPRQRVMVATDLVRFTCHALLAVLILQGTVQIWQVVAIEAVFGAAEAFFRPAYTGLIPQTVPEDMIQEANAMSAGSANLAEFLGPALAAALVAGVGAGWAFAVDAVTFLVSAGFLLMVDARPRGAPAARQTLLADLREGFGEVRSRPWVWVTIVVFSLALMVGISPYLVLGPTVAREAYGSAEIYGVIFAAFGAGMVIGAAAGLRLRPTRPMVAAFAACLPWPVMVGFFALGAPLASVIAVAVLAGSGVALFGIWWETALAERIPPSSLSRVTSYDWMGSFALAPIGYLLAGPLAELVGAPELLLIGAALTVALLVLGLVPRGTRALRRVEGAGPTMHEVRAVP